MNFLVTQKVLIHLNCCTIYWMMLSSLVNAQTPHLTHFRGQSSLHRDVTCISELEVSSLTGLAA